MRYRFKQPVAVLASFAVAGSLLAAGGVTAFASSSKSSTPAQKPSAQSSPKVVTGASTTTPIQHVVVIFDENVSFDHYFGTYPVAANPAGEVTLGNGC